MKPSKQNFFAVLCGALLFGLAACKDKPKDTEAEGAAVEPEKSAPSKPAVEIDPSSFNAKRTQAFGFLSRMPASTEGALGLRNFSDVVSGFLESNTYKRAIALIQEFNAADFDPASVQMVQAMIDQYVGKELFVIFSEGSASQFERLQFVTSLLSDFNMRAMGAGLASGAGPGAPNPQDLLAELKAGLKDENSEVSKALEEFQIPPLLMGSKVLDGAQEVIDQLNELETQLPPIFTVGKVDAAGGKFTSWRINLQDIVNEAAEAEINEFLNDPAAAKRVADILRKKTIEFTFGTVDNYLLFTLGSDHKHLKFVSKPEESILAAKAFEFSDAYLSKKLISYGYMSKAMLAGAAKGGQIQRMADAFAAGLGAGDPSMKKVADLVRKLGGQMEKMSARGSQTYVGVAYMDQGIHAESTGGYTSDLVDWKAKSQFANSAPADATMVMSSVANPKYRGDSIAMMETMFAAIEAGLMVAAEKNGEAEMPKQMKEMFGANLTKIWGVVKGPLLEGLGSQGGIIVDLKGGMPKGIPGVPNVLENEGKVPRIALAMDVQDRAKLAAAWKELVPTLNDTLMKIPNQEPGAEVQVPDVMTDESDDLVTHYFSFPFFTNDFMPSLSLNDKLFFLSTSKQFAQALAAGSEAGSGDIRGTYFGMNIAEVQRFAEGWIELALKNSEQLFPDAQQAASFAETAGQVKQLLEFTRGLRGIKFNRYETDEGAMRSSTHLHFEDIPPAVE